MTFRPTEPAPTLGSAVRDRRGRSWRVAGYRYDDDGRIPAGERPPCWCLIVVHLDRGKNHGTKHYRHAGRQEFLTEFSPAPEARMPKPRYSCTECLDGSVVNDTCDECGERHCSRCEPCDTPEGIHIRDVIMRREGSTNGDIGVMGPTRIAALRVFYWRRLAPIGFEAVALDPLRPLSWEDVNWNTAGEAITGRPPKPEEIHQ